MKNLSLLLKYLIFLMIGISFIFVTEAQSSKLNLDEVMTTETEEKLKDGTITKEIYFESMKSYWNERYYDSEFGLDYQYGFSKFSPCDSDMESYLSTQYKSISPPQRFDPSNRLLLDIIKREYSVKVSNIIEDYICGILYHLKNYYIDDYIDDTLEKNESGENYKLKQFKKKLKGMKDQISNENFVKIKQFIDDYNDILASFIDEVKEKEAKKEKQEQIISQKQKEEHVQYVKSLKTGKREIKSLEDAVIYYNADTTMEIILTPPMNGDNKYYAAAGFIEQENDNIFYAKIETLTDIRYFAFKKTNNSKNKGSLKFGGLVKIVGKFVKTIPYATVLGTKAYMPLLEAAYIETD